MPYKLTVTGIVDFDKDGRDDSIKRLLQGKEGPDHETEIFTVAIQNLEESATSIKVELVEIP